MTGSDAIPNSFRWMRVQRKAMAWTTVNWAMPHNLDQKPKIKVLEPKFWE